MTGLSAKIHRDGVGTADRAGSRTIWSSPNDNTSSPASVVDTSPETVLARSSRHDLGRLLVQDHPAQPRAPGDSGPDIGRADDPLEIESDRVAQQVLQTPLARSAHPASAAAATNKSSSEPVSASAVRIGLGGGTPLPGQLRMAMEQRLGWDLSKVRVHSDEQAGSIAARVGARALTLGSDIVFAQGAFEPQSFAGRRLIAHELVHVVQQAKGRNGLGLASPFSGPGTAVAKGVRPDPVGAIRRVPIEGLSAEHELRQQQIQSRDRGTEGGVGPGEPFDVIKKAGYSYLIEQARAMREWYIQSLLERSELLPEGLQGAAGTAIYVVDADVAVVTNLLFFDLGLAVGVGEGIVGTISGLAPLVETIVRVLFDALLVWIYEAQYQLAAMDVAVEPSEELLVPFGDDLDAAASLWREVCYFNLIDYLDGWRIRFEQASSEERSIMAGEFVGELAVFIATWQAASTKLGKFHLPPPVGEPVLVGAVAGGGAVPLATEASGVAVRVGGPIGGLGAAVLLMAGNELGTGDTPSPAAMSSSLDHAESRARGLTSVGEQTRAADEIQQLRDEVSSFEAVLADATPDELPSYGAWGSDLRRRINALVTGLPQAIPFDDIARVDHEIAQGRHARAFTKDDLDWLQQDVRHKTLAYDTAIGSYRPAEARSALAAEREGIFTSPVQRSSADKCDFFADGMDWSAKADFRNRKTAKEIADFLLEEVGRNLYADISTLPPADVQPEVMRLVQGQWGSTALRFRTSLLTDSTGP